MRALVAFSAVLAFIGIVPPIGAQQQCTIERVTYRVQGLQMSSWIMKPARGDRFPVVSWIHGAKFQAILTPIISESTPCHPLVGSGWMVFFVQTPGYGGSEGPVLPEAYLRDPVAFLRDRADNVNAAVEWIRSRPDVSRSCIVNMGWSLGGFTALLAAARAPHLYRATIADAPGALLRLDGQIIGMAEILGDARQITSPILIRANVTDEVVFVESSRILFRELQRWGRPVEYKEYSHPSGHQLFNLSGQPQLFAVGAADFARFVDRTTSGCAP